jgi:protein phosphatase
MYVKYDVFGKTEQGNKESNQDSYYPEEYPTSSDIFIIADGISAYPKAKMASELAVEHAVSDLSRFMRSQRGTPEEWLEHTIKRANAAVYKKNCKREPDGRISAVLKLAATTLDVVLIDKPADNLYFGHVGDSRIYIFKDNQLKQLTTDHLMKGHISCDIGSSEKLAGYEIKRVPLAGCKWILMATDGIYKMLSEKELSNHISSSDSPKKVLDRIIKNAASPKDVAEVHAKEYGITPEHAKIRLSGSDNMTGILIYRRGV